jgi:hypothetical protein
MKLDKALYGCIESGKLWYDLLSSTLTSIGFKVNPCDRCVFNKIVDGVQITICFHVDDCMLTCTEERLLDEVVNKLIATFEGATVHRGVKHSYLGMEFDFSVVGEVSVSMSGYVDKILKEFEVTGTAETPASNTLFQVLEGPVINAAQAKDFHTRSASLLYLGKRVRPDILTAVSFLTSRTQAPTEADWKRLQRLLRYINATKAKGIKLRIGNGDIRVIGCVDASHAVHTDMRSQSGCVIAIGGAVVFAKSSRQKLNSKSSAESELIALSDMTSQIIWTRDFLTYQGYKMPPAQVQQDNQSTMAMIETGRSTAERTRHISARYFWVKDRITSGEIKIHYCPTEEMTADILTKPLQGALFRKFRALLLNWE